MRSMAEFLIFVRTVDAASGHWMDVPGVYEKLHLDIDNDIRLTVAQKIKNKLALTTKYNARSRPGDIIEAWPDGTFKAEKIAPMFAALRCPAIELREAESYACPLLDGTRGLVKKSRYTVALLGLAGGENRLVTEAEFRASLEDKGG